MKAQIETNPRASRRMEMSNAATRLSVGGAQRGLGAHGRKNEIAGQPARKSGTVVVPIGGIDARRRDRRVFSFVLRSGYRLSNTGAAGESGLSAAQRGAARRATCKRSEN